MRSNQIGLLICGAALAVLAIGRAWSQQTQQADDISMHTVRQPYSIETFGEFRKLIMTGDFTAKVQLVTAMAKHPTIGVGALADARGEISIFDGRLVVSYGKGGKPADDLFARCERYCIFDFWTMYRGPRHPLRAGQ